MKTNEDRDEEADLRSLWDDWFESRSSRSRNEIFSYYQAWMQKVASSLFLKYRYPLMEWDDYVQYCSIGLIDAINKYERNYNVPFEKYAYLRLKGELLNGLSNFSKSSSGGEGGQNINIEYLTQQYEESEDPFDVILNVALDLAFDRVLTAGFESGSDNMCNPAEVYLKFEESSIIYGLVEKLEFSQRCVIEQYYKNFQSFSVIAKLLGVSRSRVSQIHSSAVRKLRFLYEKRN